MKAIQARGDGLGFRWSAFARSARLGSARPGPGLVWPASGSPRNSLRSRPLIASLSE